MISTRDEPPPDGRRPPHAGPPPSGPHRRGRRRWVSVLALVLLGPGDGRPAGAGGTIPADLDGARVLVLTSGTPVRRDGAVVALLNAGSVFRAGRASAEGHWLDAGSIQGWVRPEDVVPLDRADAHFDRLIREQPGVAAHWVGRAIARLARGRWSEAEADVTRALVIDPDDPWAYHNRSAARHALADHRAALADADAAIRRNPGEPSHLANRAAARFALREFAAAADDYTRAIALLKGTEASVEPDAGRDARARLWAVRWLCARAECWEALHASDRAVVDLADALRRDPSDFATLNRLAWTLATARDPVVRDGRRAFELAARACDLTGYRDHTCLGTLAAAFAELGDRSGAILWLRRAAELATDDPREAAVYRRRLAGLERSAPRR